MKAVEESELSDVTVFVIHNRPGARFSKREKDSLVLEIKKQHPDLTEERLSFEQYKVSMHGKGRSQGEKGQ